MLLRKRWVNVHDENQSLERTPPTWRRGSERGDRSCNPGKGVANNALLRDRVKNGNLDSERVEPFDLVEG